MVKALKEFRTYVLHSKIIAYVPTSAVKDILVQPTVMENEGAGSLRYKNLIWKSSLLNW